jgi:type II secretion system protein N
MPEGKASKATGTLSLEATDVGVGDGKAKVGSGMFMMALPKVAVGKLTFAGEAKDGAFKITKFAAGGQDVEVQGDGRITLRDAPAESLFDGQARFKINDAYRNRSDLNKGLVLGLDMSPDVKQSKRADGFYAWTLRGPLGHLAHIPAGGGGTTLPSGSGLGAPKVNP